MVWTQDFVLSKQVLYHLSRTSNPFCSGYFEDGISWTICLGWPWTAQSTQSQLPKLVLQAWATSAQLSDLFLNINEYLYFTKCVCEQGHFKIHFANYLYVFHLIMMNICVCININIYTLLDLVN
jgi:hypothetical protein